MRPAEPMVLPARQPAERMRKRSELRLALPETSLKASRWATTTEGRVLTLGNPLTTWGSGPPSRTRHKPRPTREFPVHTTHSVSRALLLPPHTRRAPRAPPAASQAKRAEKNG